MGDQGHQDDLTAAMQLMQQQMIQMQQTIQARQDAAEQATLARQEQQVQTVPIGERNLPHNIPTTRSAILIENMAASSNNKKEERDFSKKENSSDTQKIDELTAKVYQLLKNNQGHVFGMEQATAGQIQNLNQQQPQSNQQVVPVTGNSQSDELKGPSMMTQHLLQGQQVQAKALNQVTTEMDTRMGSMFTELINKTEHCNAIEQQFTETVLGAEENTEQSASSAVTAPDESAETPPSRVYVPKRDSRGDQGPLYQSTVYTSTEVPYGTIRSLHVQVGECVVLAEFQVIEMNKDHEMPLIFGRTFMATVGATIDMPTKRVCFSNINKKVLYKKVQKKRVNGDPMMTLIPRLCDEKSIEYEKGEAAVKGLLSRVLKLNMSDCGACFGTSPHDQPD
ncbi:uncharacterized protein LOC106423145 [Brassica napus]|uniref:uncharacterized protein LOC106423145 n=1 Tax=Brassica napus TaxID=3708 RepID=UPI0006AA5D2C|nr:uncharacterized protein LOC106423145 [Brassica napus]